MSWILTFFLFGIQDMDFERAFRDRQTEVFLEEEYGVGTILTPTMMRGVNACFEAVASYADGRGYRATLNFDLTEYSVHIRDEGFQYAMVFLPYQRGDLAFDCFYAVGGRADITPRG